MTTIFRTLIIIFVSLATNMSAQTKGKIVVLGSNLKAIQGVWTHSQDSLATVQIIKDNWIFKYDNKSSLNDHYKITMRDTVFGKSLNSSKILKLTNTKDTLEYEILTATPAILSLMYLRSGRLHLYNKLTK